jgi:hypothetical protein
VTKRNRLTSRNLPLFLVLIATILFFISESEVDPDLWGHILFGGETLKERTIHREDTYSYTAPGAPWINHEWMAEIILYLAYALGGSVGLILLKLSVVTLTMIILLYLIRKGTSSGFLTSYLFLHTGYLIARDSFIRPQLFTCLLFALTLLILGSRSNRRITYLYLFPLLMILWVNLHGGYLAGLGIFTAYLIGLFLEHSLKTKGTNLHIRSLNRMIPLLFAWAATAVNPYFLGLWKFLIESLGRQREFVSDWRPVRLDLEYAGYLSLFLIVLVTLIVSRQRKKIPDIAILALSCFFAFSHVRHIPLFAMAAALITPPHMDGILSRIGTAVPARLKMPPFTKKVHSPLLILTTILLIYVGFFHPDRDPMDIKIPPKLYPLYPVQLMTHFGIEGNIAINQFGYGEYLIFKLFPESRVAFDGRLRTVYPADIEQEYLNFMLGKKGWRILLEKYPTDIALLQKSTQTHSLLRDEPGWFLLHDGPYYALFLKDIPKFAPLIQKSIAGILEFPPPHVSRKFPG